MLSDSFLYFASSSGARLLLEAADLSDDPLRAVTTLRAEYPVERVREAITLSQLRKRAVGKFSNAADMWFDATGLEQASSETISRHRARRFDGCDRVADLCSGIGGDTLSLAGVVSSVIPVDLNPARAGAVCWNARVSGVSDRVHPVVADLATWLPDAGAAFFDPDRRPGGRRRVAYADYQPALKLQDLHRRFTRLGVKVAPGIPEEDIPGDCEVEFISEKGVCKEAVLWFGDLKTGPRRRATLLPGGHTLTDEPVPTPDVRPPGSFLYEPDAAVVRSHLIHQLAHQLDASLLNPQVAYLTSDALISTPFAAAYEIVDIFHFSLKRLQAYVREHSIGQITVKKRRFPLDADEVTRRLRLKGSSAATVVLTRLNDAPTVIVCNPVATP
jgi:hypothetical protein